MLEKATCIDAKHSGRGGGRFCREERRERQRGLLAQNIEIRMQRKPAQHLARRAVREINLKKENTIRMEQ